MRLLPVGGDGTLRIFPREVRVGGYAVPAGTEVWCYMYAAHRSASYWKDPDSFRPVGYVGHACSSFKIWRALLFERSE